MKLVYIVILVSLFSLSYVMTGVQGGTYDASEGSTVNGVTVTSADPSFCNIEYQGKNYNIVVGGTATMNDGTTVNVISSTNDYCELDINGGTTGTGDIITEGSNINGVEIIDGDIIGNACIIRYDGAIYNILKGNIQEMPDGIRIKVNDIAENNCDLNIEAGGQVDMINVCLAYNAEMRRCEIEEQRLAGDMEGIVNIEGTGTATVLGNFASMNSIINLLGIDPELFDLEIECKGARFCENANYDKRCSPIEDGVCPEDYGEWSECKDNIHGGECTPCDPDCDDCGQNIRLGVPNVQYIEEGDLPITLTAEAYGYHGEEGGPLEGQFSFYFVEGGAREIDPINQQEVDCFLRDIGNNMEEYVCEVVYTLNLRGFIRRVTCEHYSFEVLFRYLNQNNNEYEYVNTIIDSGMVSPHVDITSPQDESVLEGSVGLDSNVRCEDEEGVVNPFVYALYQGGIHIDNIARLGQGQGYSTNFDTTRYNNGNYKIDAIAFGRNQREDEIYIDSIDISINNQEREPFKILNLILAKIKTWL